MNSKGDKETKRQVEGNIDTAKMGEVDINTMIANAKLLVSVYQMASTGQIIWKSAVGDQQLESILNTVYAEVHKHNILSETISTVLKVIKETYGSSLFGPDGKPFLNV